MSEFNLNTDGTLHLNPGTGDMIAEINGRAVHPSDLPEDHHWQLHSSPATIDRIEEELR